MSEQTATGPGAVPEFHLNHRLVRAREHASLEQADLARVLGVNRNTISNAERGRKHPRRTLVMAWAMATGVSLRWLETGEVPTDGGGGPGVVGLPRLDSNQQPSDDMKAQVTPAVVIVGPWADTDQEVAA